DYYCMIWYNNGWLF
nr:immunoglobulin light chain junction region [Macaca mulatta]MOY05064.1 immunoglobulin light chain junction region [Macaca mulatta]MOY05185.1 immunoglobulin light chain junction region [Macaca mulatta]MOY05258.1 immunoglobulin light chain junction region [Macaca mulatta]MOY05319.1 immunoglobulin light chain junction region [Macaca mulatta]